MDRNIAYCGLDCSACEAYIATVNDDECLRRKVAAEWSELNGADITPGMINCLGCRSDGPKTPYCESMCGIRKCGIAREYETCGECPDLGSCDKVAAVIRGNEAARKNLGMLGP
ncbi:MAG: DUF3795 domain-containing protein [Candidatus Methanomethylophilaceae archaeon]|nr:DUF3795 domain-containing protein [Candidatus Methanomethylophilaceae archaeon]